MIRPNVHNFFSFFPYLLPELMSKVRGVQDESVCGLKNSFGHTRLIFFWSHLFAIVYNLKYDKYIGAYCTIPSWNIFRSEGPTYLTLAIMSPDHAVRLSPPLSSMGGWELEVSQILIWLRRPSTGWPKKIDNRIFSANLGDQIFGGQSGPNWSKVAQGIL